MCSGRINNELFAIYDAIITAEASGDFAAASAYSDKLNNMNQDETDF